MARIDNLDKGELRDLLRRVRALEKATPLNNASIGRNGLRVHDGGVITIENGGLKITGTAEVIGQLIGSGVLTWTGETNLEGPTEINGDTDINGDTTVTGPFHVQGDTDITGELDVSGVMTLLANLIVGAGGKIKVGGMTLDPAVSGAGTVGGITALVTLLLSAPNVVITGNEQVDGLLNAAGGVSLTNLPTVTGKTPNLYIDPADLYKLKRII